MGENADEELAADAVRIATLTARERDIIGVVCSSPRGSLKALAQGLEISERTLRGHLAGIFAKLDVSTHRELCAFALKYGLAAPRV